MPFPFRAPSFLAAVRRQAPLALLAGLSLLAGAAQAQGPLLQPAAAPTTLFETPSPEYIAAQTRWKSAITAFEEADKARLPAEDGVLFVGSSTVRMWSSLAQDFSEWPVVINRGFGGSTMAECRLLVRELVLRYKPRHVLVYAGDNDLAMGRSPLQVMEDFAAFAGTVRSTLPRSRISFISIKPSPSRAALLPKVQLANEMVAAYLRTQANVDYIDTYSSMIDAQGRPRAELFLKDQLHLNAEGYRLWHDVITAQLQPGAVSAPPGVPTTPVNSPATGGAPLASAR
ncbi:SGNH/GDSL hydrolase family protein [Xenophilus arseniciresistens]|uniref:SGNH/GDSL hydrolase family protein n=1 Tax=Xenophilus arseniciresistens TaxID=1283306 RepID=A0AAE3SZF9_9BURK|nr:SGNH/GDSL hydrolase family protein [Xenophilus arseniciresistens]MDA7415207.1 SGNH/GDSL hydrolase family protein [Xenophilus arseniciresistens]